MNDGNGQNDQQSPKVSEKGPHGKVIAPGQAVQPSRAGSFDWLRIMVGWFKVHRELFEKPIFLNSSPEQWKLFCVLLAKANFAHKEWDWNGEKFSVVPGQFVTSLDSLRLACGHGVSIQNIRTALVRFEKLGFLTQQVTKHGRKITIVNWERYQSDTDEPTKQLTDASQTPNKRLTTREEGKKERKKETPGFDQFWNAYPKKKSKEPARKSWEKLRPDKEMLATILSAIENQKRSQDWQKDSGQFIPLPSTWLNQKRWEDELETVAQPVKPALPMYKERFKYAKREDT